MSELNYIMPRTFVYIPTCGDMVTDSVDDEGNIGEQFYINRVDANNIVSVQNFRTNEELTLPSDKKLYKLYSVMKNK